MEFCTSTITQHLPSRTLIFHPPLETQDIASAFVSSTFIYVIYARTILGLSHDAQASKLNDDYLLELLKKQRRVLHSTLRRLNEQIFDIGTIYKHDANPKILLYGAACCNISLRQEEG